MNKCVPYLSWRPFCRGRHDDSTLTVSALNWCADITVTKAIETTSGDWKNSASVTACHLRLFTFSQFLKVAHLFSQKFRSVPAEVVGT